MFSRRSPSCNDSLHFVKTFRVNRMSITWKEKQRKVRRTHYARVRKALHLRRDLSRHQPRQRARARGTTRASNPIPSSDDKITATRTQKKRESEKKVDPDEWGAAEGSRVRRRWVMRREPLDASKSAQRKSEKASAPDVDGRRRRRRR